MPTMPKTVIVYRDAAGVEPFTDWLNGLRDARTRRRILQRLFRLESGNYGDYKRIGAGVSELRFFFGPGYRVYYSLEHENVILLLIGGTKDTQHRDIQTAKAYSADYRRRESGD